MFIIKDRREISTLKLNGIFKICQIVIFNIRISQLTEFNNIDLEENPPADIYNTLKKQLYCYITCFIFLLHSCCGFSVFPKGSCAVEAASPGGSAEVADPLSGGAE